MTDYWLDRVQRSTALNEIERALTLHATISGPSDWTPGEEAERNLSRVGVVLSDVKTRFLFTDPQVVPRDTLNQCEAPAQAIGGSLQAYLDTRDEPHLSQASSVADDLLATAAAIASPRAAPPPEVNALLATFRTEVDAARARVAAASSDTVNAAMAASETVTSAGQAARDALESALQSAITTSTSAVDATNAAVESLGVARAEFERAAIETGQLIATQTQRLDAALNDLAERFAKREGEREDEFKRAIDQQVELASGARLIAETDAAAEQRKIEALRQEAERILGITAASATAQAYLKDASREWQQAAWWQAASITCLIVTLITAAATLDRLIAPSNATLNEALFFYLPPVGLGGIIATLLTFTIKQANHHRDRERQSRRFGNELTGLRPFLAELPEADRNTELTAAAKRYFPGHEADDGVSQERQGRFGRAPRP